MERFSRCACVGLCRVLHLTRYAWARARAHNGIIVQPYTTLHRSSNFNGLDLCSSASLELLRHATAAPEHEAEAMLTPGGDGGDGW